jgi:hypothetical protein
MGTLVRYFVRQHAIPDYEKEIERAKRETSVDEANTSQNDENEVVRNGEPHESTTLDMRGQ